MRGLPVTSGRLVPGFPICRPPEAGGRFDVSAWAGHRAGGRAKAVIARSLRSQEALATPRCATSAGMGLEIVGGTPEHTGAHKSEAVKWAKVVKRSGAKVDENGKGRGEGRGERFARTLEM